MTTVSAGQPAAEAGKGAADDAILAALEEALLKSGFPKEEKRLYDAAIAVAKRLKAAQADIDAIVRGYLLGQQ